MIEIYTDGICEPNPGHACWAWLAKQNGKVIASDRGYLGARNTNNDAEYVAIGKALAWLATQEIKSALLHSDSRLAVEQIKGNWNCNIDRLRAYRDRVRELLKDLPGAGIKWIPSKDNSDADELTRQAYREAVGKESPIRH